MLPVSENENEINPFQLPIAFLREKAVLEEHTIIDLELIKANPKESLYYNVFYPQTLFGEKMLPAWSKYYTADTVFLKETQILLKHTVKSHAISASQQEQVFATWEEIKHETGFAEKFSYLEWSRLSFLNNDARFLQCLSMYNMAAPIFSLFLPIFFLIVPLILIKIRGLPMTVEKYIELLKFVFKKHQLGKIFDLQSASFEKIMYVVASGVFYIIQIYQNIMSCRKFYYNMTKIHEQLFLMRDYLDVTIKNMDILRNQCQGMKSYEDFIATMNQHQKVCVYMLQEFQQVTPNKCSIKKIGQVGHIMKCFYQLYKDENFHNTLQYSFGLNGYLDNLNGVRQNIIQKNMGACKFSKVKQSKKTKPSKFVHAYFPSLLNNNPVKNTYKLDKHLLITGPNAAGKTTLLKTTIFNIILSQQLGFGFYKKASLVPYDMIHCYINIPDTSARDSLFQAEAKRCKDIISKIDTNGVDTNGVDTNGVDTNGVDTNGVDTNGVDTNKRHFCVFDELYSGTNPYEAISSAYAFLKYLHKYDNVNFVLTTHFLDLCRRLEKEKGMQNYHMKIETVNEDFKYTYKMEKGISDIKGGIKVLKDLDYPKEIINNTSLILKELII